MAVIKSPWAWCGGISPYEIIRLRERWTPTLETAGTWMVFNQDTTVFVKAATGENACWLAQLVMRVTGWSAVIARPEHLSWAYEYNHRIIVDKKLR